LKLCHLYESSDELFEELNSSSFSVTKFHPGQIIEDDHYFDFEGVDVSGRTWTSSRIWIDKNVDISLSRNVVIATLQRLQTCCEITTVPSEVTAKTTNAQLYIPGKFKIPHSKTKLSIAGRSCVLEQHHSYLEIIVDLTGEFNPDNHLDLILEALSIGMGHYLLPRLKRLNRWERQIEIIYSAAKDKRQRQLPPPIPTSHPHDARNLEVFVGKFTEAIDECRSPLVGYWFRILQVFEGDVENSALVLTIAIEGLLKNYYESTHAPDSEFLHQLKDAQPLVRDLSVEERVKKCLMNALGNAKRMSPKNSLYKLAGSKLISENMVEVWKELRNRSTHADELKFGDYELQVFVDKKFVCLELLYRLVLGSIGYSGEIFQYSVRGWPKTNFTYAATLERS
jgi:hypothetical protein